MADGSLTPTSQTQGPLSGAGTNAPLADAASLAGKEADVTKQFVSEADRIQAAKRTAEQGFEKERQGIGPPPQLQQVPQPTVKATTPQEAWSSMAMVFAALASAFTRRPMMTAMDAAAGVLNAYKKGDQDAANAAYSSWRVANQNAMQVANFQQRQYDELMRDVDRRQSMSDKEAGEAEAELKAKIGVMFHAFGDQRGIDELEVNGIEGAKRYALAQQTMIHNLELHSADLEKQQAYVNAMADWRKKHPNAGPDETLVEAGRKAQELKVTAMNPSQAEHAEQSMSTALMKPNSAGAQYEADKQNETALNQAINEHNGQGIIAQASALDRYVRMQTGNRAIRGFQLQLLTHDAGLMNQLNIKLQQLGHGGMLSQEMIADMRKIAHDMTVIDTQRYADSITAQQWVAHNTPGMNPENIVPSNFERPQLRADGSPWPNPVPAHVAALKANNKREAWIAFDETYGQGAAADVMGPTPDYGQPEQPDEGADAGSL